MYTSSLWFPDNDFPHKAKVRDPPWKRGYHCCEFLLFLKEFAVVWSSESLIMVALSLCPPQIRDIPWLSEKLLKVARAFAARVENLGFVQVESGNPRGYFNSWPWDTYMWHVILWVVIMIYPSLFWKWMRCICVSLGKYVAFQYIINRILTHTGSCEHSSRSLATCKVVEWTWVEQTESPAGVSDMLRWEVQYGSVIDSDLFCYCTNFIQWHTPKPWEWLQEFPFLSPSCLSRVFCIPPNVIQEFWPAMSWGITLFTTPSTKSIIWRSACDGWRSAILKYLMLDCHGVCLSHDSSFVYFPVRLFPRSCTFASSSDSSLTSQSNVDAIDQLLASLCNSSPNQFAHTIRQARQKANDF